MSVANGTRGCIDPETLAAFAEGRMGAEQRRRILAHLDGCETCMAIVESVSAWAGPPQEKRSWTPVWAVAAAVLLALLALPFVLPRLRPHRPIDRLVALAPRDARVLQPRVGGLPWAPDAGRARGEGSAETQKMKLGGVAADLIETADKAKTPEAEHDAGVALLLLEKPDDAVKRLRAAADASPGEAMRWNDLAAGLYAAASANGRPSLYPDALAACDHALRLDANLPEALFNRALVLERLGLNQQARAAWTRYLHIDPSSQWANEARSHLAELPATTRDVQFRRDQSRLEQAAAAGDRNALLPLVDAYRQRARTFAEGEYLGHWGEAVQAGDAAAAARQLSMARAVGDALVQLSGESLVHDAVAAIDGADAQGRARLAEAHAAYRRGRIALSRKDAAAGERDLRHAAALFAAAHDPMELLARSFVAAARFDQNDIDGAAAEARSMLSVTLPQYRAIAAQLRSQLAVCAVANLDWPSAAPLAAEAEQAFHQLGEQGNEGWAATVGASALLCLGRTDAAWAARVRANALLDTDRAGDRLAASLAEIVRTELTDDRTESARAFLQIEEAESRAAANAPMLVDTLIRSAVVESRLGLDEPARAHVREAATVAATIPDAGLRARALADVQFAEGAAALRSDPGSAETLLSKALAHYDATARALFVPELLLLRARARLRLGRNDDARADLATGIAVIDRHRDDHAGTIAGTGALDAGRALFQEAIRLGVTRGDTAAVFAYAEQARAQLAGAPRTATIALAELQGRLRGSGSTVLDIIVLPEQVVTIAVTERTAVMRQLPMTSEHITSLAAGVDDAALRELYDVLIRPAQPELVASRQLIVVADPVLQAVPFGSLFDTGSRTYLVQRLPVAAAPSATSLEPRTRRAAPSRVATLALTAGAALPALHDEIHDVTGLYRGAVEVAPSLAALVDATGGADVLHISGHTERQPGDGDAALLLPSGPLAWRAIAAARLRGPATVVLAACETLRPPAWSQTQPLSLGGGFLAAGAADVIGTVAPVPDNDARRLFRSIHRELAAGAGAAEAVRRAQIEAINERQSSAWRTIAVLTRRI